MFKKISIFYLTALLLLINCNIAQDNSKDKKLVSILENEYKIKSPVEKIFILNGFGCGTCNRIFSQFLINYDSKNTIYLISDNGQFFIKDEMQSDSITVINDYKNLLIRDKIIKPTPAFIKMEKNTIDTIIHFSIEHIEMQLTYISRLD